TVQGLVIGGFTSRDISIVGDGNIVRGNYLGTNAAGTAQQGNRGGDGVQIDGQNNTIGGTTAGTRNVISGKRFGVTIYPFGSGNVVQGNYIGTDASGTGALGNTAD